MDNYPPGFDYSVDSGVHDDCVRAEDAATCFTGGLQAMREMIARFVEGGGDTPCKALAESIRANWNPSWGADPGRPDEVVTNWDQCI
jgi:hypothetical protein